MQGLILAVMRERARGATSRWAPYLDFLPPDLSHMPMCWPEGELRALLRGTAAYDKLKGRVQRPADAPTRLRLIYSEVVEPFIAENPKLRLPSGALPLFRTSARSCCHAFDGCRLLRCMRSAAECVSCPAAAAARRRRRRRPPGLRAVPLGQRRGGLLLLHAGRRPVPGARLLYEGVDRVCTVWDSRHRRLLLLLPGGA
jgi:hypothetical protein